MQGVGQRLKLWRACKGLKGYQLARLIGFSRGSLSEIENSKTLPSARTIVKLMRVDGLDIFWLLTGEGPCGLESPQGNLKWALELLNELTENHRRVAETCRKI